MSPFDWMGTAAELWARWTAHDPASEFTVDHAPWERFPPTYVVPGIDGSYDDWALNEAP